MSQDCFNCAGARLGCIHHYNKAASIVHKLPPRGVGAIAVMPPCKCEEINTQISQIL